ncbi:MAG TPA: RNA-binding domain-containing protein [Chloroflexota bacterium]
MPRRRRPSPEEQPGLLEARVKTAPCVPALRKAVAEWRVDGYKGATDTTRTLFRHWFITEHRRPGGRSFQYHHSQREAIETLAYVYEVAGLRRYKGLVERFASNLPEIRHLQYDEFARYAVKMATGSGKTKVMSLAIAWQYFNAVAEGRDDFARTFLLIAPNVIVFERLRIDFAGGRIFRADPIIPPELALYWDLDCYLRGESERAGSEGALYLTNIQQLYDRPQNGKSDEVDVMTAVLGSKPPAVLAEMDDFDRRIVARRVPCMVLNDEAHHTHDERSEWNTVIRRLHEELESGLTAQLDFSATPRFAKGTLFTWTIYDYPLKQAIIDNVVKRPMKGVAVGIKEQPSDVASVHYQAYLTAGVERWREYREQLAPLGKRPILFLMLNDTADADDVGDYLRVKYPEEFAGDKLLVIHTDRSGEVSKRDLDLARRVARDVDEAESPVNAIVSVLMLREGWDVQNVTVVVGLRPYTSKANILPEQAVGRGLRLMFRGTDIHNTYRERVDVIGNSAFMQFVDQLEREEEMELGSFEIGKDRLQIITIAPDDAKLDMDIAVPRLTPILARKKTLAEEIRAIDVNAFQSPPLPRKPGDTAEQSFKYEGYDIITLEKQVEREYTIPEAQTSQEVISYFAKRIAHDVKLPSQFAELVPKVRDFLRVRAFGESVDLDDPVIIKAISRSAAQYVTLKTFVSALRAVVIEEQRPELDLAGRPLSETPPFPYSRPTLNASKTVFNLVPCDNQFEKDFARALEDMPDVVRFSKLPSQFGFAIEYTDSASSLRYYEPDFVAVLSDGTHYLVETKGREDLDVAHKDRAAQIWCENATLLTGTAWRYLKVAQTEYKKLQPADFEDLLVLAPLPLPKRQSPSTVLSMIEGGESDTLEFKSSIRWDMRENTVNPVLEKVIVKTVAGFLNSAQGGALLVGVSDDGTIVGLQHDYASFTRKPDRDGFELHLTTLLLNAYGKDCTAFLHIRFHQLGDKEVCEVAVKPANRPIFVKDDKGQQLFIRANNQTLPLSMEEAWNYSRIRWPT